MAPSQDILVFTGLKIVNAKKSFSLIALLDSQLQGILFIISHP